MRKFQGLALHTAALFCCFLVGAISGCIFALMGQPDPGLQSHLNDYFLLAAGRELSTSFLSALFCSIRWPLAVIAAAFMPIYIVAIPGLLLLRGFFLTYTTTCFSILFGGNGLTIATLLFSVSLLFELPALFIFSDAALRRSRPGAALSDTEHRNCFCAETLLFGSAFLIVAVALQLTAIPNLFSAVCTRLFT